MREVPADLDVAEETEARLPRSSRTRARPIFSFGWSGATPSRTSPQGVGSRSIMSTSTGGSALEERAGRVEAGGPGADDRNANGAAHRRRMLKPDPGHQRTCP